MACGAYLEGIKLGVKTLYLTNIRYFFTVLRLI